MVETHLPAGCWIMVALIAAFMVWLSLSVLGAALEYERKRRALGREVTDLRRKYSMSFPDVIISHDVMHGIGAAEKAA